MRCAAASPLATLPCLAGCRTVDKIPAVAQLVRERGLGQCGLLKRHRRDVLVPLRRELDAIFRDDAGRLVAALVVGKALFDGQARHADVKRLATVAAARIPEADDIHAMMRALHVVVRVLKTPATRASNHGTPSCRSVSRATRPGRSCGTFDDTSIE